MHLIKYWRTLKMEGKTPMELIDSAIKLLDEMEEKESWDNHDDELHTYSSVVEELEEIYLRKNSDYGNSFEDALDEFGEVVGLFMLKMKYDRMTSLFKKGTSEVDESIVDSLDDMINYGIMFSAWLKNKE